MVTAIPRLIPGERAKERAKQREHTAIQKAVMAMDVLYEGRGMRTCDIAAYTGASWWAAKRMMEGINGVLPKVRQDKSGMWYIDLEWDSNRTLANGT